MAIHLRKMYGMDSCELSVLHVSVSIDVFLVRVLS